MEEYDVVIGGGVAGSVAARFAAKSGFKTLLVEKLRRLGKLDPLKYWVLINFWFNSNAIRLSATKRSF